MAEQGYNAANVLDDMRKLNLVAQRDTYAGAAGHQASAPQHQQQQANYDWQQSHRAQQGDTGVDFEADQLASALEFALNDGGAPPPMPPPHQYQQHGAPPGYMHQQDGPPSRAPPGMQMPPLQHQQFQHPQHPQRMMYPPPPHMYGSPAGSPMMAPQQAPYYRQGTPPMQPMAGYPPPPMYQQLPRRGGLGPEGRCFNTSRMKAHELSRLIEQQQKAVSSDDPLTDDFYALKMGEKRAQAYMQVQQNAQQRARPTDLLNEMKALLTGAEHQAPSLRPRNGPLSQEHLGDLGQQMLSEHAITAKKIDKAREEWHDEHKVLGRSVKSNLKRPRELIAQQGPGSIGGATFQSQLWILRGVLGKIAEKLIDIADVHEVMQAKVGAARTFQEGSASYTEAKRFIEGLQRKQVALCNDLGQLLCYPSVVDEATGAYDADKEVELVGGWNALFFLIWTPKGRHLVLRSIPCLLRPHQRAILKVFCTNCAYFVCRNPDGQDEQPVEDDEARLDLVAAQTFADELRHIPHLDFVTDCLRRTFEVFEQSPAVLSVFVHIPAGQQVIRALLQHGKALSADPVCAAEDRERWNVESDKFYGMMKVAVTNLEKEGSQ